MKEPDRYQGTRDQMDVLTRMFGASQARAIRAMDDDCPTCGGNGTVRTLRDGAYYEMPCDTCNGEP